jgi:transposase
LPEFEILCFAEEDENCIFEVEKQFEIPPVCPVCGSNAVDKHGRRIRHARDVNLRQKLVGIDIKSRRYRCKECGKTFSETYDSIDPKAKMTNRLKEQIQQETLRKPFIDILKKYSISSETARRVFKEFVDRKDEERILKAPEVLGIDEAHLSRYYRGVFTNVKDREIIEMIPKRNKTNVVEFLSNLPGAAENTKVVTMDMWNPYKQAVNEVLPKAAIVIDKFHVVKELNNMLDKRRLALRKEMSKEERGNLRSERYLYLNAAENLSADDEIKLKALLERYPAFKMPYNLKEDFRGIYKIDTKEEALMTYGYWKEVALSNDYGFEDFIAMVERWKNEIFEYFDNRYTNAFTESINNLIKNIEKQGRGYCFDTIRAKVLYGTFATKPHRYKKPEYVIRNVLSDFDFDFDFNMSDEYDGGEPERGFGVDMNMLAETMMGQGLFPH